MLALLTVGSLVLASSPVAAAPPDEHVVEGPPLDTDEEPSLDTDAELPLDTDEEPSLDTDEAPAPTLDEEFDRDEGEIDDGYSPLRDSPEAKTARRWLGAGIAATSAGAILVGGSIALAMTDPCDPLAGNNCFIDARNRAALTMGVPGGVLLLGGVAMTIVGAVQKRRLFFEYAGSVSAGRDHIGVVVVGRF